MCADRAIRILRRKEQHPTSLNFSIK